MPRNYKDDPIQLTTDVALAPGAAELQLESGEIHTITGADIDQFCEWIIRLRAPVLRVTVATDLRKALDCIVERAAVN